MASLGQTRIQHNENVMPRYLKGFAKSLPDGNSGGSFEVMAFAIDHDKGNESRANLALRNHNEFLTFTLNPSLCSGDQLVSAFCRNEDKSKLAVNALWKFHVFNLF